MTCVVVLGSHGGGTSLVAGILDAMGVQMSYNPNAKIRVPRWTYLNYEDSSFVRLNNSILKAAGGNWNTVPSRQRLAHLLPRHELRLKQLVAKKSKTALWGFKDPRTALTVHLLHPFLGEDVRYIYVQRGPVTAANSIQSRGYSRRTHQDWIKLVKAYYRRIDEFVENAAPKYMIVRYETLVDPKRGGAQVTQIAKFLGLPKKTVQRAMKRIRR